MDLSRYSAKDFDRGAPALQEALWVLVKILFFQNPIPWSSGFRVALLRAFGAEIGDGVVIRSGVNITFPWRLIIGDHVWIGEGATILTLAPVSIGSHVCISQGAYVCTGSHEWRSDTFDLVVAPISIASQTWVAAQAFVGPGVTVGERCVISARSVVMKDVPAGSRVAGNPARPVSPPAE